MTMLLSENPPLSIHLNMVPYKRGFAEVRAQSQEGQLLFQARRCPQMEVPGWPSRGAVHAFSGVTAKDPSHRCPIKHQDNRSLTRKRNHFLILAEVLERC